MIGVPSIFKLRRKTEVLVRVLKNTRRSDGVPEPDGSIKVVVGKKIIHYRQLYIDRHHREALGLANDIPEESVTFVS